MENKILEKQISKLLNRMISDKLQGLLWGPVSVRVLEKKNLTQSDEKKYWVDVHFYVRQGVTLSTLEKSLKLSNTETLHEKIKEIISYIIPYDFQLSMGIL